LGRDEDGLAVLEQAAGQLPAGAPTRASAHVLASLARGMGRVDRIARAGELARLAVAAAEAAGAHEEGIDARITLSMSQIYAGDVDDGLALVAEAGAAASRSGLPMLATRAYVNHSDALLLLGRYAEAAEIAAA